MRRLILKMSMSLDGYVAGPHGEADWLFRHQDEGATAWIAEMLWQAGLHAMGSRTFRDMAAWWPTSSGPLAAPMNAIPKIVFTRQRTWAQSASHTTPATTDAKPPRDLPDIPASPNPASWTHPQIANGDLAAEVTRLKRQPGKDILAHGGAGFARSLASLNLIDEFRLLVHPIALGTGLPLFTDLSKPLELKLLSTTIFGSGVAAHTYRRT